MEINEIISGLSDECSSEGNFGGCGSRSRSRSKSRSRSRSRSKSRSRSRSRSKSRSRSRSRRKSRSRSRSRSKSRSRSRSRSKSRSRSRSRKKSRSRSRSINFFGTNWIWLILLFFLCGGLGFGNNVPVFTNVSPFESRRRCDNVLPFNAVSPFNGVGPFNGGCNGLFVIIILLILVGGFGRNRRTII